MKRGETRSNWTSGHWVWLAAKVNQEYQVYLVYHEVTREYWVNKVRMISCTGERSARMRGYPGPGGVQLGDKWPSKSLTSSGNCHPSTSRNLNLLPKFLAQINRSWPAAPDQRGRVRKRGSKTSYSLKMGPWYCAGLLCFAAYCVTGPFVCWNFSSTVSPGGVERRCCFWGEFNWVKRAPRLTLTFHYNGTPHHTTPSDGWTLSSSSLPLWRDDPWKKKPQAPALWCLTIRTSDPSPKPPLLPTQARQLPISRHLETKTLEFGFHCSSPD